jgi:hypothetical protein
MRGSPFPSLRWAQGALLIMIPPDFAASLAPLWGTARQQKSWGSDGFLGVGLDGGRYSISSGDSLSLVSFIPRRLSIS